jgi:hypothetical protein
MIRETEEKSGGRGLGFTLSTEEYTATLMVRVT